METKEFVFKGVVMNGFLMLFAGILLVIIGAFSVGSGIGMHNDMGMIVPIIGIFEILIGVLIFRGFIRLEPNEARVMMFFGKYRGTFTLVGFHWVNPFINTKHLSLRARNLDAEPIKVNDKVGNPVRFADHGANGRKQCAWH